MRFTFAMVLAVSPSLFGWNAVGHRVIAAIAYDRLTDVARARVDELLTLHPDYSLLRANLPQPVDQDPKARARAVFLAASVWPDRIRIDPRFFDETKSDTPPPPLLKGFPDMGRHLSWHYFDTPFSPDETVTRDQPPPHALSEITRILSAMAEPVENSATSAYSLVWLVHLVGDVHQPLHAASRFLSSQPGGDEGGNLVFIAPNRNLHSVWDQALGTDSRPRNIDRLALELVPADVENPPTGPAQWLDESFELDRSVVYTFGSRSSSKEVPLELPEAYHKRMVEVSRTQVTKAGMRLAEVLNENLQ